MDHEADPGARVVAALEQVTAATAAALAAAAAAGGPLAQARAYGRLAQVLDQTRVAASRERGTAILKLRRDLRRSGSATLEEMGRLLGLTKARVWQIISAAEKRQHHRRDTRGE